MRVLITAGYLGKWGETDGIGTTYEHLIGHLGTSGHRYDLVCYGPGDEIERHGSVTIITHRPRLPVKIEPVYRLDAAIGLSSLARRLERTRYDLVQSSTPEFMGVLARRVARLQAVPFVPVFHTMLHRYVRIRFGSVCGAVIGRVCGSLMERWIRHYYNSADLVLAPSHAVRRILQQHLEPPVQVLARGVDTARFSPEHRSRTSPRPRALYVGRVAPEKNLAMLVDVFRMNPGLELMVVGDGPYLERMRNQLPEAIYTGRLEGQRLLQAYADADFFVFPSETDTLGNAVLEAMSSGLPAIVTDKLGPQELVDHGRTGLVCPDSESFAAAVVELASDADVRRRMSRAAREAAKRWQWLEIANHMTTYHRQVVDSHRQGVPVSRMSADLDAAVSMESP